MAQETPALGRLFIGSIIAGLVVCLIGVLLFANSFFLSLNPFWDIVYAPVFAESFFFGHYYLQSSVYLLLWGLFRFGILFVLAFAVESLVTRHLPQKRRQFWLALLSLGIYVLSLLIIGRIVVMAGWGFGA